MFEFVMAPPSVAVTAEEATLVMAATPSAQSEAFRMILENCEQTEPSNKYTYRVPTAVVMPASTIQWYVAQQSNGTNNDFDISKAKVTILEGPKFGRLEYIGRPYGEDKYSYTSNPNFVGEDRVVSLVELNGRRYKIVTKISVKHGYDEDGPCSGVKRIGDTLTPNGATPLAQSPNIDPATAPITFTLADLPGQSLGLTSGTSITLDTNGAGHGWYFDWLGSANDWLPTSDPQEWMARPGSAADGRMDFLTVFFHEYGHALGLEHSVDTHDLMATTLSPGVRRLPSPDDMALFATVNSLAEAAGDTPQPYSQPSPDHC